MIRVKLNIGMTGLKLVNRVKNDRVKNGDTELEKDLACFRNCGTLMFKWDLHCLWKYFTKQTGREDV